MDASLENELNKKLSTLKSIYNVDVTPQASVIIGESLQAIISDPHRSWPQNVKKAPSAFQTNMLDALPSALAQTATDLNLSSITSFDLLHAMTDILNLICPFTKPPP